MNSSRVRYRVVSKHEDNPRFFRRDGTPTPAGASMLAGLDELGVGTVLYRRLRLGEWCSAEGAVWQTYQRDRHLIHRPYDDQENPISLHKAFGIQWFFGSQDWGWSAPGCLQIWGVAPDGSPYKHAAKSGPVIFRVAEVYHSNKLIEWWVGQMAELHKEFNLEAIVCDPEDPSATEEYNVKVGDYEENKALRFARPAMNRKKTHVGTGDMGGLDLVRQWFAQDRIFLLKDSLRGGIDPLLKANKKPFETSMELPSYVYRQTETGKRVKELTDEGCVDHGCATLRYGVCFAAKYDLSPLQKAVLNPKAIEHVARHWEVQFDS